MQRGVGLPSSLPQGQRYVNAAKVALTDKLADAPSRSPQATLPAFCLELKFGNEAKVKIIDICLALKPISATILKMWTRFRKLDQALP